MQLDEQTTPQVYPSGEQVRYTSNAGEPSIGSLFTDLTDDMGRLVRQEIELARVETMQKVTKAMRSVVMLLAGGLVAYAGLIVVLIGIAILLGEIMPYWASSLVVGAVVLVVGAVLIGTGRSSLQNMTVVPEKTVESIKEDARWAKEQVS